MGGPPMGGPMNGPMNSPMNGQPPPPPMGGQTPPPAPRPAMPPPPGGPSGINSGTFAEGGVVDQAGQPSMWQKLWGNLMGKQQMARAANPLPTPSSPPANQDTSIVRRAAEEAGRRNDEQRAARLPSAQSKYGDYGAR